MPRALAEEIANDLWTRSDGQGEVMLSGQNTAYLMERDLGMLKRIQFIGNNYQIIHDPSEVPEEITKVSVYLLSLIHILKALDALAEQTQCTIVGQAAVLAEGDAAERKDIIFLVPLPLFFH